MKKGGAGQHAWYVTLRTKPLSLFLLSPTDTLNRLDHSSFHACRGSLDNEYDLEREGELDASLEDNDADSDEARDHVYFDTTTGTIIGAGGAAHQRDASSESDSGSVDGGSKSNGGRARTLSTTSNPGISEDDRARARRFRTGSFNGNRTSTYLTLIFILVFHT